MTNIYENLLYIYYIVLVKLIKKIIKIKIKGYL